MAATFMPSFLASECHGRGTGARPYLPRWSSSGGQSMLRGSRLRGRVFLRAVLQPEILPTRSPFLPPLLSWVLVLLHGLKPLPAHSCFLYPFSIPDISPNKSYTLPSLTWCLFLHDSGAVAAPPPQPPHVKPLGLQFSAVNCRIL